MCENIHVSIPIFYLHFLYNHNHGRNKSIKVMVKGSFLKLEEYMMKQLWAAAALSLLMLAGCSSNTTTNTAAMDGKSIYAEKCSACHGENLKGLVGPSLLNIGKKYSEADITKITINGSDKMPGHLLPDDQSKIVAQWLLKK